MWWFLGWCIALGICVVAFIVLGILEINFNYEFDTRIYTILMLLIVLEIAVILFSFLGLIFYSILY